MTRVLNRKLSVLVIFIVIIHAVESDGILDFEYTEYTQSMDQNSHHNGDFNFKPALISSSRLQFPQACDLMDQLRQPLKQKQDQVFNSDIDSYLNDMKLKFLNLLTLTQKLTNSQDKILHFQSLINQTNPKMPEQEKMAGLENFERKLTDLTSLIRENDRSLRSNLSQIDTHTKDRRVGQSKIVEIDFAIQFTRQKISYLQEFQRKANHAKSRSGQQIDYNRYFEDLQRQFRNQSVLLQNIDSIIQKKDNLARLKKQKSSLESSIMALELYIKDIRLCNKEKENIRSQFKNHGKINVLINELTQLKKTQEPNGYCVGVVKKLTQKIITMVRYYDIVASCASDLQPKIYNLGRQKENLMRTNEQIARLQSIQDLQGFQRNYKQQRSTIEGLYSKIKSWKMKQFYHNPDQIASIKNKASSELQHLQAQRQKYDFIRKTASKTTQKQTVSYHVINLINQIRNLKGQYAKLYNQYDTHANKLWAEVYKCQSEVNLKSKLFQMYNEERRNHQDMHRELIILRQKIYQKLN